MPWLMPVFICKLIRICFLKFSDAQFIGIITRSISRPEDNVDDLLEWMIKNFEHNYKNNRSPFGVYLHAAWFLKGEHYFEAYVK